MMTNDEIRAAVRANYGALANAPNSAPKPSDSLHAAADAPAAEPGASPCCGPSCCGGTNSSIDSRALGYSEEELACVPEGADLGLGCGNPRAIAALQPGETVLDLGSGAGFDALLAARQVGPEGRVVGVDMTPEMNARARENAVKSGMDHVEFRLGEIEHLPVADGTVDVIISNCVINLSPEKDRVFREAFRVLRPGGRLAVSDIVATAELPGQIRRDMELYTGCVAGASTVADLERDLAAAGFTGIRIGPKTAESRAFIREWIPGSQLEDYVVSANIGAVKPEATA